MNQMLLPGKTCTKCEAWKTLDDFSIDRRQKDGRRADCRACASERARQRRLANLELYRERDRKYRETNADAHRRRAREDYHRNLQARKAARAEWRKANKQAKYEQTRRWTEQNKQRVTEYRRKWREDNPEKLRNYRKQMSVKRRAQMADRKKITDKEIRRILSGSCAVPDCTDRQITVDHIIPLAKGGRHAVGNLQPLCHHHNARKQTMFWFQFLQTLK